MQRIPTVLKFLPIATGLFLAFNVMTPASLEAMPVAVCENFRISVQVLDDTLDFAATAPCGANANITVNQQTGAKTVTGCVASQARTQGVATIRVTSGQVAPSAASKTVRVTINEASSSITSGANSMTANTFRLFPCNCTTTTQSGTAVVDYTIGGNVVMGSAQPAGIYTGTFSVTAECN